MGVVLKDSKDGTTWEIARSTLNRHGRACPGHPRLALLEGCKDVDARDERGHDDGVSLFEAVS